ncbi:MAG: galactitol-1-phosphate 5-dehydrogenase [Kiritimatiellae bacterium]|nr:galactitol-1-phosphate 5-dehydrogenase [Kiritimatiellia bacterium]
MKALVLKENGVLSWEEHELQEVPGWYRIRIAAAGVCGSDLGRGFKNGAYHYPLVMGHEFSGVVETVPDGGSFPVGTRVAVYPLLPCGSCVACQKGYVQLCLHYDYFGSRRDGAFAECLYVPESNILPVPDDVTLEEAAMCEPAAVAHHAVYSAPVEPGVRALVIGGGPIGLIAAQWLRIRGAGEVTVADIDSAKLTFAEKFGFRAVDSRALGESELDSFDVVAEACGVSVTRSLAVRCCARKGHVFWIGNPADDWLFEKSLYSSVLRKELSMNGSWNSVMDPDWTAVLAHAGRELNLKDLVTSRVPMSEGSAAFARILNRDGFHCKTLLVQEGVAE